MNVRDEIYRAQRDWALSAGMGPDEKGYIARTEDNLPWLCGDTRAEISAGDGNEFGGDGKVAKIAALHSSSALAVNVFDYWRTRDRTDLAAALGFEEEIAEIRFEQKFPTGVGPRDPNIDVVIRGAGGKLLAIESKFCETFGSKPKSLRDAYYVAEGDGRWRAAGLPGAQDVVDALREKNPFQYVDAPQLLKHMLGLARSGADWSLLLMWFAPGGSVGEAMASDAERFKAMLGVDGGRFSCMSYQTLWTRLSDGAGPEHAGFVRYLGERYFGAAR